MSNLLVEIGNTALKAAWSDGMTLGKTFRYQGEKWMEFLLPLTRREKPAVLAVSSVYPLTEEELNILSGECGHLMVLDKNHQELLLSHGLPAYLSYDRAASVLASRYLFRGMPCTIVDFGTTLSVDFLAADGSYTGVPRLPHPVQGAQPVFPVATLGEHPRNLRRSGSGRDIFHRSGRRFGHTI